MTLEESWRAAEERFRKEYPIPSEAFDQAGADQGARGYLWQYLRIMHDAGYRNVKRKPAKREVHNIEIDLDELDALPSASVEQTARIMPAGIEN